MPTEMIITEKPSSAKNISLALAKGKAIKEAINGIPFYKITHGNKDIIVVCAVGHLYGLTQKGQAGWKYPIFDVEWVPSDEVSKGSAHTKKYLQVIKKLSKEVQEFTVACDYDIEGEVIGFNIVRFACKQKDAARMKFSTQTKEDLVRAYTQKSSTLDWGQAHAGEARHILDWYYGINLSRALSDSIKAAGSFKIMSTGRVQGPALKLIVDKEKEILAFISTPYWQIELFGSAKGEDIHAVHEEERFTSKEKADAVMKNVTATKTATVISISVNQFKQQPPYPFDLTSLQLEAHKTLGISPKETLSLAQELYVSQVISYPRTSSQQLPKEIGYTKVLKLLAEQSVYADPTQSLLKKKLLVPHNGKKTDPAHPAIYPTGIAKKLEGRSEKLYDLIVRRFLATFGDEAVRETMVVLLDCNTEKFVVKGTRTVERGWHVLYGSYAQFKEEELPNLSKGDKIIVKTIECKALETQPPKRYTDASVIKELEKNNVGTKATRAQIIETLFQRGYVDGKSITATELGMKTIDTLALYCPDIIDVELTRHFEDEMEEIREKKKKQEEVLAEAKEILQKILVKFDKEKKTIGEHLLAANRASMDAAAHVGKCLQCDGDLTLRKGKFGSFVACKKYPECNYTVSLPQGLIKPSQQECKECQSPTLLVIKARRRPQEVCINKNCPTKKLEKSAEKEVKAIESGKTEKKCPNCDGIMLVRKSLYGLFLGCSKYPKCKTTEKLAQKSN